MIGKLLGRLAYRGWRDGDRPDRRWARGRDERLWRRDAATEATQEADKAEWGHCEHPAWQPCARCDRHSADWMVGR